MTAVRQPTYLVEFATPRGAPAKAKGDLFEALVKRYLFQQSYRVTQNIRHTGGEVDLLCEHELSHRVIIAECKSQKEVVQSAAIDSLYTDVDIHDAAEGWLVSIAPLGKEAKGKLRAIQQRHGHKFIHVDAQDLVHHAIKAGAFADPSSILALNDSLSEEITLILTQEDDFFCLEHRSADRQVIEGYTLLRASDLKPINTAKVHLFISDVIDRYSEARWLSLKHTADRSTDSSADVQPIVELTAGMDWRDYRPSRPEDFIGREAAVSDVIQFVEKVRMDQTSTRLFGVKAQSGWGKSSLILKAADKINSTKPNCYFFAVDCRAAVSSDYGQLAIATAMANARCRGTEFWGLPSSIPASSAPFAQDEVKNGLRAVANSQALVIVVFDQFEEIIHTDNKALFAKLESLCYQIDSLRLPILLGFSWRTDAMVSADNPGYSLWHKLADKRHDVELRPFTSADAREYIEKTEKNAGAKLAAKDRRFLLDNYVGLPWLLKKLTINLLTARFNPDSPDGGEDGTTAIARLFDQDLQELSPDEHACLRTVGASSPMPMHTLYLEFSNELVTGLIQKRLLINAGGQVSLYSDIFRDYLLYNRLPFIPNTHCPSVSAQKLVSALLLLSRHKQISYKRLASNLSIAVSSADNVARDLQQMGIAKLQRSQGIITSLVNSTAEATAKLIEFLKNHIILEPVLEPAHDEGIEFPEIVSAANKAFRFSEISRSTVEQYTSQVVRLAMSVGLVSKSGNRFFPSRPIRDVFSEKLKPTRVNQRADGFMAQAPPSVVLKAIECIRRGQDRYDQLRAAGFRNALFAAASLGLVERVGDRVRLLHEVETPRQLFDKAVENEFVAFAIDMLADEPNLTGPELGLKLAGEYGLSLHPSSLRRYGGGLLRWAVAALQDWN